MTCSPQPKLPRVRGVTLWLIFCAFCTATGWLLSLIGSLNAAGYAVVFGAGAIAGGIWMRRQGLQWPAPVRWAKWRRRARHLCPMFFVSLAAIAFLGGVLYPPTNYDGLAYRETRVLHWLAEGRWHWIHTPFNRVNTHAPGFEWVTAPLIAFTRTDRLAFLINVISFCLLPGLLFSVFTRLGVRRRVAYCWMWLVPSGYCYLLQAASIGNDLFVGMLAVAAIDYALRARDSGRISDLWLSILAMGSCTGAKANAIPLGLVWLVLVAFSWPLLKHRICKTAAVVVIALGVSYVPMGYLNWRHCGDLTGGRAENIHITGASLGARLFGNAGIVLVNNLTPPVAPFAHRWNNEIAPHLIPARWRAAIGRAFDTSDNVFTMEEMQIEESGGFGFGMSLLVTISSIGAVFVGRSRREKSVAAGMQRLQWVVFTALAISMLAVMKLSFAGSTPRLLSPYYPLLIIPFLLHRGQECLIRRRWWRAGVIGIWLMAVLLLILSPARPLFPAQTVLSFLRQRGVAGPAITRAEKVYSVYGQRHDAFAPVVRVLPPDLKVLGFVTFDDPEPSLWWPFGSRRIVHIGPDDTADFLRNAGVHYVLISPEKYTLLFHSSLESWLNQMRATVVESIPLTLRAGSHEVKWLLVRVP
jgi:hypothetical protein